MANLIQRFGRELYRAVQTPAEAAIPMDHREWGTYYLLMIG